MGYTLYGIIQWPIFSAKILVSTLQQGTFIKQFVEYSYLHSYRLLAECNILWGPNDKSALV